MRIRSTVTRLKAEGADNACAMDVLTKEGTSPPADIKVLHIVLTMGETSAPYNEHCLPLAGTRDITVCTYFRPEVKAPESIRVFGGDGSLRGFLRTLKAALNAKQYDVIHAHAPHVGFLFLMSELLAQGKNRHHSVFTIHNCYRNYRLRHILMLIPVFVTFKRVVCCSRASYQSFPSLLKQLARDRLRAVQNGMDIARVDSATPQPGADRDFTIVTIGRLANVKNHSTVLKAFRQAFDAGGRLLVIGNGPLKERLQQEARDLGLSGRVELSGLIPRERVYQTLKGADLFVSASRGEGLPVAVLEAMACRCPVVLSDIEPHREICEGVDFIPLVNPGDVEGFSREVTRFHQMTIAERLEIGLRCRELVEERFSLAAMHRGYEKIYAEVVDSPLLNGRE